MSKKLWIIVIGAGSVLMLLGVAAVVALVAVPKYRAQQHLEQAEQAAAADNVARAKRYYREYLYLNPDDATILERYAELCASQLKDRRQNLVEAGRAYLKLAQIEPDNTARREQLVDFYRRNRLWDDLESAADLFLRNAPDDAKLHYAKAIAIEGRGRVADAIAAYEDYLEDAARPRRDVPLRLARLYREQEQVSKGDAVLEAERKMFPDDPDVLTSLANYEMDRGALDAAAELLPEAFDSTDSGREVARAQIRLLNLREDYEGLLAHTREVVRLFPEEGEFHLNLMLALERLQKRQELLEHAASLDPAMRVDMPGILLFEFEVLLAEQAMEKADAVRQEYKGAYPNDIPMDEYLQGRVAYAKEDLEAASENFTLAVEMNPNLDRARYYQAVTYLRLEDMDAGRVALELYMRNNPEDDQARQMWARYFDRNRSALELRVAGQRLLEEPAPAVEDLYITAQDLLAHRRAEDAELARKLFEKALSLEPNATRGYQALAGYYLETGDIEKAENTIAQAEAKGVDASGFGLLKASLAILRGDLDAAMQIADESLDITDAEQVKQWATFFSRRGFLEAGRALLQRAISEADSESQLPLSIFSVELSVQFASAAVALEELGRVESAVESAGAGESQLNRARILVAQRLLLEPDADARDRIAGILEAVEASEPDHDGLGVLQARMALGSTPPDFTKAEFHLRGVDPESSYGDEAHLVRAEMALMQGRFSEAESLAGTVSERAPNNKTALHLVGDARMRMGDTEGARAVMERILEIDRSDARAVRLLVRIYSGMQLRQKADTMFERYKALASARPELEDTVDELRMVLDMRSGKYAEAESRLREKLAQNPIDYAAINSLARSLAQRDEHGEAARLLRDYVDAEDPQIPEPWTFLGQLLLDQRDAGALAEASSAFTQALLLVPRYAPAQLGNIEVQSRLGNDGVAIAMCDRYLDGRGEGSRPSAQDAQVYYQRAALRANRDTGLEKALADVNTALDIVENPLYLRLRGALRYRDGDADGAIADLRRVEELTNSLSLRDRIVLVEAYLAQGDIEEANRHAEKANGQIGDAPPPLVERLEAARVKLRNAGGR